MLQEALVSLFGQSSAWIPPFPEVIYNMMTKNGRRQLASDKVGEINLAIKRTS